MLNKIGQISEGERGRGGEREMGRWVDAFGQRNLKIQFKCPTAFQYPEYEVTDIDEPAL